MGTLAQVGVDAVPRPMFGGGSPTHVHDNTGIGAADLASVQTMTGSELRALSEAAATQRAAPVLWAAISARCEAYAEQMKPWNMVSILQAFAQARVESQPLFLRFAESIASKTSKMAPKHVLDVLALYEAQGLRPRTLYVELLHTIVRLSRSMYAEELTLTLQALARYQLGNPTVVEQLMRTVHKHLGDMRLRYLCGTAGALGVLRLFPPLLIEEFDKRARFEVETVPVQELLDNLHAFPSLEFSWQPYEDLCLSEFLKRVGAFRTAEDVNQLVDPFQTMHFLQARSLLNEDYLKALCQWCLLGVHQPNVRSERRPTSRQLVLLHDRCAELGIETEPALQDALQYFVESAGGIWPQILPQPLRYRKQRRYVRREDPIEHLLPLPPLPPKELFMVDGQLQRQSAKSFARLEDLPGLPADDSDYIEEEEEALPAVGSAVRRLKSSWPNKQLQEEGRSQVGCWTRSRRSPKNPRHRPDPGLKKFLRKDWPNPPLWYRGGWAMHPKYHHGQSLPRTSRQAAYPWPERPVGARGAARILRR